MPPRESKAFQKCTKPISAELFNIGTIPERGARS